MTAVVRVGKSRAGRLLDGREHNGMPRGKGWRMPEGAIYVGRPTKWGNPFRVGQRNPFGTITTDNRHGIM